MEIKRLKYKGTIITTTAATTVGCIYKDGYVLGSIINPTTAAFSVAWYGVYSSTMQTPYAAYDEDAVAATQTIPANSCVPLPISLAGVPIIKAVTAAAASSTSLYLTLYG